MRLLLLLTSVCFIANAKPLAKVFYVKGNAYIDKTTQLKKGSFIEDNQTITTHKSSLVVIGFGNYYQSKMKIAEGSELYITKSLAKSKTPIPTKNYNVFLKTGNTLINFVRTQNRNLTVHTKNAALGIRGTTFFTNVDENDNLSLAVNKGVVGVGAPNSNQEVPVSKGEATLTNEKAKVIAPREMEWTSKVNWSLNPLKGNLFHSKDLFASIEQSYQKYKKEQEAKLQEYRKEMQKKVNRWDEDIIDQKKRMFGN